MKSLSIPLHAAWLAAVLPAAAAERFWDGGDATANLNAAANWDGNAALNLAADDLNFPTGMALANKSVSNNYPVNTVFRTLNFLDSGYSLGGPILGITNGVTGTFATGNVALNAGFSLQANQTFAVNGGGDFIFGGGSQIFLNGRTLNLQPIHADSVIRIDGGLAGGIGSGIRITKAGTVNLNGAKAFSASVSIEEGGTLVINDAGGLGDLGGDTSIPDGTLVLDNLLPVNVPENLQLTNTSESSNIISRGGAHTLSGAVALSGSSFKNITVEGPSLTMSGRITGDVPIGAMVTRGPGRLILSGTQDNTLDINIFRVWDSEVFLNKAGGAQALSVAFIIVGHNGANPNTAILRLGAANQIHDNTVVEVSRDGWFDLNGKQETIPFLQFAGAGRVTGNGGTLRLLTGARSFGVLDPGATAVIDCPVVLSAPVSEWDTMGAPSLLHMRVNGPVSSTAPDGGILQKTGEGELNITGTVSMREAQVNKGTLTLSANSFLTDARVTGTGKLQASGALKEVTCEVGTLVAGTDTTNTELITQSLTIDGTVSFTFTSNAPGGHDVIHTAGAVTIGNGALANFTPLGAVNIAVGEEVILINNGGTDAITGEFSGASSDQVVATEYWLSYTGGDGNDLSITRIVPPTNVVRTWDGGGNDDEWMTPANWNGNAAPNPGDALVFPEVAQRKLNHNNYPAGTSFHSVTVHGAGNGLEYAIGGNRVRLNTGVYFMASGADHLWGVPITFSLPGTISSETTSLVQVGGDIDNAGKQLTVHQGDATLGGNLYMSQVISGAGGLRKTGPGTVTLFEHTNTYTGVTTVQTGELAITWDGSLGAAGAASGTYVAPGATLKLRSNEDPFNCSETVTLAGTIADSNGQAVQFNGPIIVEGPDATLRTSIVTVNGAITGTGTLHKAGPGVLTLSGGAANTFSGGFMADGGETRLQKIGNDALPGPVIIGNAGETAKVTLLTNNQIGSNSTVQIVHESGVLDTGAFTETIGGMVMTGGTVQGTAAGQLTLNSGVLITQASNTSAVIAARLAVPPNVIGSFTIADGGAAPDLRVDGVLAGNTVEKQGPGRMDLTPAMGAGTLTSLWVQSGSALVHGQCPLLTVTLKGGLIGGNGRVSSITADSSGTVSPGINAGLFSAGQLTWNASTTFRVELNGTDPGTGYDQLISSGTVNLSGAKLALTTGFDPAPGSSFLILRNISASPIAGTFVNAPEGGYVSAPGAKVFQVTYTGGDGDDVELTRIEGIAPEVVNFKITPDQGQGGDENKIDVKIKGMPGLTYQLETSADMVQWSVAAQGLATFPDGFLDFQIFQPESAPRLFFRARLP